MSQHSDKFTDRERQILTLVVAGLRNRKIARELCIAEATVENHMHNEVDAGGPWLSGASP